MDRSSKRVHERAPTPDDTSPTLTSRENLTQQLAILERQSIMDALEEFSPPVVIDLVGTSLAVAAGYRGLAW